jgi:hypothetical protein
LETRLPQAAVRSPLLAGDHRRGALVDGVDDLGVVDPAQVHRGDRQVGVSELALDDQQRDSFP